MTIGDSFPAVIDAAKGGEDRAVAVLYRDLQPALRAFVAARCPREADDLCADVWLAVARGLPSFSGDEPAFRGWLFTIARRQVVGQWRRDGRRRTDVTDLRSTDAPGGDDTATEAVERLHQPDAVTALVAGLPADQADVVLLRVVAGLDVAQVAQILGKRPGTVRVLQHRALQRLAKIHGEGVTR